MNLPDPANLLSDFDRSLHDDPLSIDAPVEEAFDDLDPLITHYARRRLGQELERQGRADEDPVAGIGVSEGDLRAVDDWIVRYVSWRTRFGDVERREP